MATLWVLKDGEGTDEAEPAARGSLVELKQKFRLGELSRLHTKNASVSIGKRNSALPYRRHAVLLLETHEEDMAPGCYAGRISA